jgi:DNA-directed RNA polymerase specialized sigma24 family protein
LSIATKLTTHKNFRGYRHDMKDDMIQEACVKCLKNLKNVDPSKGSVFSYFTHVCWSAFVTYLAKYYTGLNRRRELMLARIEELESNPNLPNNPKLRELYRELEEELGLRKSEEF